MRKGKIIQMVVSAMSGTMYILSDRDEIYRNVAGNLEQPNWKPVPLPEKEPAPFELRDPFTGRPAPIPPSSKTPRPSKGKKI